MQSPRTGRARYDAMESRRGAGAACQEFVIPCLTPARQFLEPLRVTELPNQVVLPEMSDAGLELFDSGLVTAGQE